MYTTVTNAARDLQTYKAKKVAAIRGYIQVAGTTTSNTITIDFSKIKVKIIRMGFLVDKKPLVIWDGNMQRLMSVVDYGGIQAALFRQTDGTKGYLKQTYVSTTTKGIYIFPFEIPLGVLDLTLSASDALVVEFDLSGAFMTTPSTVDHVAEWDIAEAEENAVETSCDKYEINEIAASKGNEALSLGDDIDAVIYMNDQKTGYKAADETLSVAKVSSNLLNTEYDVEELIAKQRAILDHYQFVNDLIPAFYHTYKLMDADDDFDYDNVSVTVVHDTTANINAARSAVIVRRRVYNPERTALSFSKARKAGGIGSKAVSG